MKRFTILAILAAALAAVLTAGCASSKSAASASAASSAASSAGVRNNAPAKPAVGVEVKSKHDTYDLIKVPFKDYGYAWSYQTYVRPHYPAGVPRDIYEKIWVSYVKTIERGDYDYDAFNKSNAGDPNWVTPIGEYKDDASFHFHGVCFQYADYFEMLIKKEPALRPLIDKGVLRSETAPDHKYWVYQESGGVKYYIDPTWGDWTVYGTPMGIYANNLEYSQIVEQSPVRELLTESRMRSWFFIQANAIGANRDDPATRNRDRSAHNL